jgi:hypothetical protein
MAVSVFRFPGVQSSYQIKKARLIAARLVQAACESSIRIAELPALVAHFSEDDWRAISFECGIPVADKSARILTIAFLQSLV